MPSAVVLEQEMTRSSVEISGGGAGGSGHHRELVDPQVRKCSLNVP
jgi:hypothetical protein